MISARVEKKVERSGRRRLPLVGGAVVLCSTVCCQLLVFGNEGVEVEMGARDWVGGGPS